MVGFADLKIKKVKLSQILDLIKDLVSGKIGIIKVLFSQIKVKGWPNTKQCQESY